MKIRWLLVALLSATLCGVAACGGGDSDNPFEGSWIADTGARITFTDDAWWDSDGDAGTYTFAGEDPVYTLEMETETRRFTRRATFLDADTIELCVVSGTGTIGACVTLVNDDPTLH